ncbi:MAG: hypothetical protein AAGG01_06365, partial [Planctomycetota bacterium]
AAIFTVGAEIFIAGGRRLAAGGQVIDGALDLCSSYDPASDTWIERAALPTARAAAAVGKLEGRYQVIGGRDAEGVVLNITEEYDPGADAWRPLAVLPASVAGAASATIDGRVILAGGSDGTAIVDAVSTFNF